MTTLELRAFLPNFVFDMFQLGLQLGVLVNAALFEILGVVQQPLRFLLL
jgi:hypothetical protein